MFKYNLIKSLNDLEYFYRKQRDVLLSDIRPCRKKDSLFFDAHL